MISFEVELARFVRTSLQALQLWSRKEDCKRFGTSVIITVSNLRKCTWTKFSDSWIVCYPLVFIVFSLQKEKQEEEAEYPRSRRLIRILSENQRLTHFFVASLPLALETCIRKEPPPRRLFNALVRLEEDKRFEKDLLIWRVALLRLRKNSFVTISLCSV